MYDEASDDSSQDQFYEQPDWVKVSEGSSRGYEPIPHHSIAALQISARKGCHLCNLIADKIPEDYTGHENSNAELWQLFKNDSSRLEGVVVARPYAEDANEQQDLCLEVSYWLDGDSENTRAYFLTVDLELRKVVGKSIVTLSSGRVKYGELITLRIRSSRPCDAYTTTNAAKYQCLG